MTLPDAADGDIDALELWAHKALAAALRAQARKPAKTRKPRA
jgi:TfoX/Sxy family transcriptional regulator of competence genes